MQNTKKTLIHQNVGFAPYRIQINSRLLKMVAETLERDTAEKTIKKNVCTHVKLT